MRQGFGDLIDEAKELMSARGREELLEELSDVTYAVGRLCGAVIKRPYVPMPFDKRHRDKIQKRVERYGCIRSERWLLNGQCPGLGSPEEQQNRPQ